MQKRRTPGERPRASSIGEELVPEVKDAGPPSLRHAGPRQGQRHHGVMLKSARSKAGVACAACCSTKKRGDAADLRGKSKKSVISKSPPFAIRSCGCPALA